MLEIQELQGQLDHLIDRTGKVLDEAKITLDGKASHDFRRVKAYGKHSKTGEDYTSTEIHEQFTADTAEMNALGEKISTLKSALQAAEKLAQPTSSMNHPGGGGVDTHKNSGSDQEFKSIGQLITEDPVFKQWSKSKGTQKFGAIEIGDFGIRDLQLKTLFERTAGWAPESIRSGRVVDAVTRPIQLIDIMPPGTVNQAAYVYMLETTRTHAAQETAEGAAYKESTFVLTETTKTVQKITDSVPVTDEQLEDVVAAQSYLDMRLRFGVRQRLDKQILDGDESTPNLAGILNESGIQTQAKGDDPVFDAIHKGMTKVTLIGRASTSHIVLHQNDWQKIRLNRTNDGIYILGNPGVIVEARLFGIPVVQTDVLTEGVGLVGAFTDFSQLFERRGIVVEIGFSDDDFLKGKQHIRASMRAVIAWYRPPAFATVTGINV
ncbi:hypothetical protein LCGC14_2360430 [marine sediment metagenome]|uniref:Phage capsid-like C-terminal domain-containing protein n=1 Tax=marine sediment metagenome TaxID=412755 RepID=A0A0F9F1M1_9ZZZZ